MEVLRQLHNISCSPDLVSAIDFAGMTSLEQQALTRQLATLPPSERHTSFAAELLCQLAVRLLNPGSTTQSGGFLLMEMEIAAFTNGQTTISPVVNIEGLGYKLLLDGQGAMLYSLILHWIVDNMRQNAMN